MLRWSYVAISGIGVAFYVYRGWVAPFLSWLRAMEGPLPHQVDFFYSSDGEPPFGTGVRAIAERQPGVPRRRIHREHFDWR